MTPTNRNKRMNCFPFVERHEAIYAYGDGTVYYMNRPPIPSFFKADNTLARAIFVVRNPIARLISHFKFAYKSLPARIQNINDLVALILESESKFKQRRLDAGGHVLHCFL